MNVPQALIETLALDLEEDDHGDPDSKTRVLVIPDLHQHIANGQHWLDTQQYARAVFLGDYFDHFEDSVEEAANMAKWLKGGLQNENLVFLLGNHDIQYRFPHKEVLLCPGYSRAKARAIRRILTEPEWRKFKLVHVEGKWVLSHAGFHPAFMKSPTPETLVERCSMALAKANRGVVDPIFSFEEGGVPRFAGPAWLAWENFMPIPGLSQLVGHTSGDEVRVKAGENSVNLCLDVRNAEVAAVIQGRQVKILRKYDSYPRD